MAASQSITGRFGSATLAGVTINITKWTEKGSKNLADATDSGNYDPVSGQTYMSQAVGVIGSEVTLEGNFDAATTSANVTSKLKTDGPWAIVLKISPTITHSSANYDLEDVETSLEVPGGTMVSWTASAKSNGIISYP